MADLLAKVGKAWEVARARVKLRACTEVGAFTRLRGSVLLENRGVLRLGDHVKLFGRPTPIELVALRGAELSIGDGTFINRGVSICARKSVRIGANCALGNDCLIFDTDFHNIGDGFRNEAEGFPITIGDNVWLAARSMVLKGVTIGDGAVVSAGAVVVSDVAPYTVVGGVPARLIRKLTAAEGAPEPLLAPEAVGSFA
jgi:acetyltransferase-like isoleucine patch superfamily enzyme